MRRGDDESRHEQHAGIVIIIIIIVIVILWEVETVSVLNIVQGREGTNRQDDCIVELHRRFFFFNLC